MALFSVSFLVDLIYAWQRDLLWYRSATYAMAMGYLGALAAAVPGAIDFSLIVPREGRVVRTAAIHALGGLSLLIVYAVNLALRLSAPAGQDGGIWLPLGLSAVGVTILAATAWFGGELIYRHHIGVQELGR